MAETSAVIEGWDEVPEPGDGQRFCRIPGFVMTQGIWADMKPSEVMLFGALCFYANQKAGYRVWASSKKLLALTGLNKETLRIAKGMLKKRGLIIDGYHKKYGQYSYWIAYRGPHHFAAGCTNDRAETRDGL